MESVRLWGLLALVASGYSYYIHQTITWRGVLISVSSAGVMTMIVHLFPRIPPVQETPKQLLLTWLVGLGIFAVGERLVFRVSLTRAIVTAVFFATWFTIVKWYW